MKILKFINKKHTSETPLSIENFIDLPVDALAELSEEKKQYLLSELRTKTYFSAFSIFKPTFLLQNLAYDSKINNKELKLYIVKVLMDITSDFEYNINLFEKVAPHTIPKNVEINKNELNIFQEDFQLLDSDSQKKIIDNRRDISFCYLSNFSRFMFFIHNIYTSDKFDDETKRYVNNILIGCLKEIKPDIKKLHLIENDIKK